VIKSRDGAGLDMINIRSLASALKILIFGVSNEEVTLET
jgi:hypothetical protein